MELPRSRKLSISCILAALFMVSSRTLAATFTLVNSCQYTIWPGVLSNAGWPLLENGGFTLQSGQSSSFSAPAGWSGRFWARTGCAFSPSGEGTCASGDCGGRYECSGTGATPPATLAEFSLAATSSTKDFYDVSLVDGYNIPVAVVPKGGSGNCGVAGCSSNLNNGCPGELQVVDGGQVVGCKSACSAFRSAEYCCEGPYGNPSTCKPSTYSEKFKAACPNAYSYAFDDPTSTFTCSAADYIITFCPRSSSEKSVSGLQPAGSLSSSAWYQNPNSAPSMRARQPAWNAAVVSAMLSLLSLFVLLFRCRL